MEENRVKIVYVVPGIMSLTELGTDELERRKGFLQENAGKDVRVEITDVEQGPSSIESAYEEYLSVPETVKKVVQAEEEGFDGVIVGCYGDPGMDAVREMVTIPVVGPGETSMLVASMLGHRFSIITVLDSVVPSLEKLARIVGVEGKLASVRAANIPVLDLKKDVETTKQRMVAESENAMTKDRADVIILGCMSMAFMGVSDEMQEKLGIPVVNPAVVSLKVLEGLITAGLTHSKKAYPIPPKLVNQE
jgi:allantoin racemase